MFGIKPGYTFDWRPSDQPDEIKVTVVPDRAVLSKRLQGAGAKFSPGRSAVSDLIRERQKDPSSSRVTRSVSGSDGHRPPLQVFVEM